MYSNSVEDVLNYVRENDVKFIRLAFCDIFGVQKNIAIQSSELPRAFESGISFDASAIRGFMNVEKSDLLLFPEPATLAILPWRPDHRRVARLFCTIRRPDGTPFEGDARSLLRRAADQAAHRGYLCKFGPECEFYLFRQDEEGEPTLQPLDHAGYFDIAPLDRGENLRRDVCLALEEMGFTPETSHHEQGPGQNEIDFRYSNAVRAADNLITFKAAVKAIAAQHGLYASFLPKPLPDAPGSGTFRRQAAVLLWAELVKMPSCEVVWCGQLSGKSDVLTDPLIFYPLIFKDISLMEESPENPKKFSDL